MNKLFVRTILAIIITCMFSSLLLAGQREKFQQKNSYLSSLDQITWLQNLDAALQQADKTGKPVLINFYTNWCGFCRQMNQTTFKDKTVRQKLRAFIPVRINTDKQKKVAAKYSIKSLPTTVILDSKGKVILNSVGYMEPRNFLKAIDAVITTTTTTILKQALKELELHPYDYKAVLAFAEKNIELRRYKEAVPWLERIIEHAPADQIDLHARANFNLGMVKAAMDDPVAAVPYMDMVISAFANHQAAGQARRVFPRILYLSGEQIQKQGDYETARTYYQRLVKEFPNSQFSKTAQKKLAQNQQTATFAPELDVTEWLRGQATSLQKLRGKVVLLDFFQIICPGCHRVHPHILQMQEKYGKNGLQVIGIAVAFELQHIQKRKDIREFIERTEFNYPVGIDKNFTKTFRAYKARGTPYAAIIDQAGNLKYLDFYNPIEVESIIRKLLLKDV